MILTKRLPAGSVVSLLLVKYIRLVQEPVGSLTSFAEFAEMAANSLFFPGKLFRN
jgi:hypothetical protein